MDDNAPAWHREIITTMVARVLRVLQGESILAPFYLAGGTGLALHLGHRRSVDLDFFTGEFAEPAELVQRLQRLEGFSLVSQAAQTLHVHLQGTKVSFLGYAYPVLFPLGTFEGVKIADPRDIACMKISAVAGRGTKRDFVDLYTACRRYGLSQLLPLFKQKYAQANYSTLHVLKSLCYFEEAEKEPLPDMAIPLSWEEVKQFFTHEVLRLR
jgi:hypothetical protein